MSKTTTIKVSKKTLKELERLRDKLGLNTLEATIKLLIRENRRRLLDTAFGLDKNRLQPFSEEDRGENRS